MPVETVVPELCNVICPVPPLVSGNRPLNEGSAVIEVPLEDGFCANVRVKLQVGERA